LNSWQLDGHTAPEPPTGIEAPGSATAALGRSVAASGEATARHIHCRARARKMARSSMDINEALNTFTSLGARWVLWLLVALSVPTRSMAYHSVWSTS
jgi:hypothetical protein